MQEIQGNLLDFRRHQADWIALPASSRVVNGVAVLEPDAIAFAERYPKLELAGRLAYYLNWGGNHVHCLGPMVRRRSRLLWSFPIKNEHQALDLDLIYQSCHELWIIWYYHRLQTGQAPKVVLPRISSDQEDELSWHRIRRAIAASFPEEEFLIAHEPIQPQSKRPKIAVLQSQESPTPDLVEI